MIRLSIALTKGRLEKESVRMFERCDYGVEELKNKAKGAIAQVGENGGAEAAEILAV